MPLAARLGTGRAASGAKALTESPLRGSGSGQSGQRPLLQMGQQGVGAGVDLEFVGTGVVNGLGFGGWGQSRLAPRERLDAAWT